MPPHGVMAEHREDDHLDEEIRSISEEQRQTRQDLSTFFETVRDMVVTSASLRERSVDETPPTTSD